MIDDCVTCVKVEEEGEVFWRGTVGTSAVVREKRHAGGGKGDKDDIPRKAVGRWPRGIVQRWGHDQRHKESGGDGFPRLVIRRYAAENGV